jgi:ADP-sugar diphosphatase
VLTLPFFIDDMSQYIEKQKLIHAHKYQLWMSKLKANGLHSIRVDELYSRYNGKGEVLFSLLYTDATTPEGHKIPPICFLKGEVVCVLICLVDRLSKEKYLLLVRQRRICDGSLTYEHPAGMLDSEKDAAAVAVREVEEETGIAISKTDLIALNEKPYFPSTGTSDEAAYFFACELEMTAAAIASYHQQDQGLQSEHEHIQTYVVPFVEGNKLINNCNGLLMNLLYLKKVEDWTLMQKL